MMKRFFSKTTADLPFAKMRFTAFGRAQYALHAMLYFATVAAIYEGDGRSHEARDGDAATPPPPYAPLACLLLGLLNSHAGMSEAPGPSCSRSP